MRIAVPVTQGEIPNHFGHCESFLIVDLERGKLVREVTLPNPGHGPGGPPPAFIAQQGVTQVLAWGMPPHAQEMFAKLGIRVQLGATGKATHALHSFLSGTIRYTKERLDAGGSCSPSPADREAAASGG